MPKNKEDLCAITVFRETWHMLEKAKNIEEAKKQFKQLILDLILE